MFKLYKNENEYSGCFKSKLAAAGLASLGLLLLARPLANYLYDSLLKKIMTDPYDENLWEFVSVAGKVGYQNIVETNLRSVDGAVLQRPFGSPKKFPNTDDLVFNMAQLHKLPTPETVAIETRTIIGKKAARPLEITMPIMVTAMAFGLGLDEKARLALCRGCTQAGTAINSGEGPCLPAERKNAEHYIYMYDRAGRRNDPRQIQEADAVEIQFGQGALAGIGHATSYEKISPKARRLLALKPGQPEITPARMPGIEEPRRDLPRLVSYLRELTGGAPIGAKIGAGHDLENDIEILLEAGVDFIALDGAEAATKGGPPILQDDFGLPTAFAVNRAARYLESRGVRDSVSLIAGGGLYTPGSFLKMLALGADAVYIGTIALMAMSHIQALKAMPFEPPPQLIFAQGHCATQFKIPQAADNLANFLVSCNAEMAEGVRALGKTSLREVNRTDLAALSAESAHAFDLPPVNCCNAFIASSQSAAPSSLRPD